MRKKVPHTFPGVQVEYSSGPTKFSLLSFPPNGLAFLLVMLTCLSSLCSDFPLLCAILHAIPWVLCVPRPCLLGETKFRHHLLYEGFLNSFQL